MPADLYQEWRAFDLIESINPLAAIVRGLSGKQQTAKTPWMAQKAKLLQHIGLIKRKK